MPEPVLDFPAKVTENEIRKKLTNSYSSNWLCQNLKQIWLLINGYSLKRTEELLKLNSIEIRGVAVILTGYYHLKKLWVSTKICGEILLNDYRNDKI